MPRKYYVLDVFTEEKLAGNPLAVVLSSDDINGDDMQRIAAEFNLSETVFVMQPEDVSNSAAIRIFTPKFEMPFAGHPTVGTAVLLSLLSKEQSASIKLELKAGPVIAQTEKTESGAKACFTVPGLPEKVVPVSDPDLVAKAVGLKVEETGFDTFVSSFVSVSGTDWLTIPVKSAEIIARAKVDSTYWQTSYEGKDIIGAYLYTNDCVSADASFHSRMFAPHNGIVEDPATGSASAAFAGCISHFLKPEDGVHDWKLEQGYEMGRPSQIFLRTEINGGMLSKVEMEGHAVVLMDGNLHI